MPFASTDELTRSPRSMPASGSSPTTNEVGKPAADSCTSRLERMSSVVSAAGAGGATAVVTGAAARAGVASPAAGVASG